MAKSSASQKLSLDVDSSMEMPSADLKSQIQQSLLAWYRHAHRDLPWRLTQDPYAIWISEIMLQQTRVEAVKEYYQRFLARFPTPLELAKAPLEEVLGLWSGLGYYTRARNLHKAAHEIADTYGGKFPVEPEAVRSLPGIGPYTAGAILSIAFGQPAPLVDGNVIRVLSRIFAIEESPESAQTQKKYWRLATSLVPTPVPSQNNPGDFNQALMELGATVCLPQNPTCLVCPVNQLCQARLSGEPNRYPPKKRARVIPTICQLVLMLTQGDEVFLVRRPELGLWGGMFEPPTLECKEEDAFGEILRLGQEKLGLDLRRHLKRVVSLPKFEQTLTHRQMKFIPYLLPWQGKRPVLIQKTFYTEARWVNPKTPQTIGLAVWVSKLLSSLGRDDE